MPAVFHFPLTVTPAEIDQLGHANNLVYLEWMIRAALAHSAAQGWPAERYESLGAGWIVRSHEIKYLRPAFVHEEVIVRTWVADTRRASSLRRYRMLRPRDGVVLATAATEWAFVNFASGGVVRIPPEVAAAYIVAGDEPSEALIS